MKSWLLPVVVVAGGCGPRVQQLPDGSYRVECEATLARCVKRAEQFCRGEGYRILEGKEENTLVGVEGAQTGHLLSRVVFVCRDQAPPSPLRLPPRTSAASTASSPVPAGNQERICIPGSTQACVGPGACQGGQACLPDGSGYGPCDCGAPASVTSGDAASPTTQPSAVSSEGPRATP